MFSQRRVGIPVHKIEHREKHTLYSTDGYLMTLKEKKSYVGIVYIPSAVTPAHISAGYCPVTSVFFKNFLNCMK